MVVLFHKRNADSFVRCWGFIFSTSGSGFLWLSTPHKLPPCCKTFFEQAFSPAFSPEHFNIITNNGNYSYDITNWVVECLYDGAPLIMQVFQDPICDVKTSVSKRETYAEEQSTYGVIHGWGQYNAFGDGRSAGSLKAVMYTRLSALCGTSVCTVGIRQRPANTRGCRPSVPTGYGRPRTCLAGGVQSPSDETIATGDM